MLAVQVMQQIQRDARMREAADQIRDEVARLAKDVGLLGDRVRKLQTHFNQANEDIRQSIISVEKIEAHGERIQQVELGAQSPVDPAVANGNSLAGNVRRLEAGE
jgi:DNA recombination protein RmuC